MDPTGDFSSRTKKVLYGRTGASWDDFSQSLKHPELEAHLADTSALWLANPSGSGISTEHMELATLQNLVKKHGMSKASDICDRIYALISLASDCRNNSDALKPDYNLTCREPFYKVLRFFRAERSQDFWNTLRITNPAVMQRIAEVELAMWQEFPDYDLPFEALDREIALRKLARTMHTNPNSGIPKTVRLEYEEVQQPDRTDPSKAHLLQLVVGSLWKEVSFYREFSEKITLIASTIHENAIRRLQQAINKITGASSGTKDRISDLNQVFDVIT